MCTKKAGKRNSEWAAIQDLKTTIINMFKELKEVMHKEVDEVTRRKFQNFTSKRKLIETAKYSGSKKKS